MAAFAAYAFAWMRFPGRRLLFAMVVATAGRADPDVAGAGAAAVRRPGPERHVPRGLAGAHRRSACRWRSSCSTTTSASCRATCSSRPPSTAPRTSRSFRELVLPLSVPALASFAIFQFLWVWNDLLVALVYLGTEAEVARPAGAAERAGRHERRVVAPAHGRRVRDDDRAARRVPAAAAVLRARDSSRARSRGEDGERRAPAGSARRRGVGAADALLGRVMIAFEGQTVPRWVARRLREAPVAGMTRLPAPQRRVAGPGSRADRGVSAAGAANAGAGRWRRHRPTPRRRRPGGRPAPGARRGPDGVRRQHGPRRGRRRRARRAGRRARSGAKRGRWAINVVYAPVLRPGVRVPSQPGARRPLVRRRPGGRGAPGRGDRSAGCRRAGVAATVKHFPGHGDGRVRTPTTGSAWWRPSRRGPRCDRARARSGRRSTPGRGSSCPAHVAVPALTGDPTLPGHALARGAGRPAASTSSASTGSRSATRST